MLNFYINRAGNRLKPSRKRALARAKGELRKAFGRGALKPSLLPFASLLGHTTLTSTPYSRRPAHEKSSDTRALGTPGLGPDRDSRRHPRPGISRGRAADHPRGHRLRWPLVGRDEEGPC